MSILLKTVSVTFALVLTCSTAHGQVTKRLQNAAERAAERTATQQTEKRTEKAVNKGIDDALDGNKQEQQQKQQGQQQQTSTADKTPAFSTSPASSDPPQGGITAAEMTYARNDFVPGDVIMFDDDVANEKLGEFPSQWDLDKGNAEVASINGVKAINLRGYTVITPLINPSKNYLPDVFTIEFDLYGDISDGTVECEIGFNDSRAFIPRLWIYKDRVELSADWKKPDGSGGSQGEKVTTTKGNEWFRVSISFNQRALKYYINGVRYLNIPNMAKPTSFWMWQRGGNGTYIKNIRVAKGAVPLYDRMMSDGKFITYGITFDVGKSTIKPESMGEINRIVTLMKENPDLKFSVEGHTDNTGSAANNQTLSETRSKAVVDKLVSMGIASDRLKAAGKGQTSPIADNGTDEGRAKNRRVEFVKIK
jgi:outer membrane protein OmpA-like peptidoglycan-associated protein